MIFIDERKIEIWLEKSEDEGRADFVDAMFDKNGEETFDIASAVEVVIGNELHVLAPGDSLEIEVYIN
jgi:hypothetical protein